MPVRRRPAWGFSHEDRAPASLQSSELAFREQPARTSTAARRARPPHRSGAVGQILHATHRCLAHGGDRMPHITLNSAEPGIRGLLRYRPETGRPLSELAEVLLRGPSTLTRAAA